MSLRAAQSNEVPVSSLNLLQQTLKSSIPCTGVGVHSGLPVTLRLIPAPAGTGIVFRRIDLDPVQEIPARWDCVVDTRLCTVIGNELGATVGTIEHLMAALAGSAIDNLVIELNGPEVPIMDGSAAPFVFLIECAGVRTQDAVRKAIKIVKPVTVEQDGKRVTYRPASDSSFAVKIDFAAASIGRQQRSMVLNAGAFKQEVAEARTFGFLHEVDALRRAGLARGGSLDNAVVIDGDKVLNREGLRFSDEFARHKLLDAVGDLYLAGMPVIGHFEGIRPGHAINNRLLHALFATKGAWREVELSAAELPSIITGGAWPRQAVASAI